VKVGFTEYLLDEINSLILALGFHQPWRGAPKTKKYGLSFFKPPHDGAN
jgi:hypothetical protein